MLAFILVAVLSATPTEHDFVVKDFHFAGGETMPEVRMHYVTYGTNRGNNAVLILHGTGGSSRQFLSDNFAGVLFAPGGLLDQFPHYTYTDMIELQHRLLADGLGITHLYLVLGTSMGAMHAWMWGERWPDAMDALVPLASAPAQIAGRNRVWREMVIDDLHRGDVEAAVQILMIATSAPLVWQKAAPTRDDADRWLTGQLKTRLATTNAEDLLYAVEASRDYDPSTQLERITAPLLAINSADDFVNPPELGIVEALIKRVKHGRFLLIPISSETRGHGTHTAAAVWKSALAEFLAGIPAAP